MSKRFLLLAGLLAAYLAPGGALAQRRESLSDGEIAQIREAQEPNDRLKLYVEFAKYRLDTVEKTLASNDADRAAIIHGNLTEYDAIIDAIDANVEQSSRNRSLFRKGLEAALKAEPDFLKLLEGFRARNPADLQRYRFVLDQAIETTQESIAGLQVALDKQPKGRKEEREEKRKLQEERIREEEKRKKSG